MKDFIPQMTPLFGKEEENAVNDYMSNVGFITEFKKTEEFTFDEARINFEEEIFNDHEIRLLRIDFISQVAN